MKLLCFLVLLVGFASLLEAQDAEPTAHFSLLGDITQQLQYQSPGTSVPPSSVWELEVFLRPKFTYGPVAFLADSTWYVPMTASLTPSAPTVYLAEAYFRVTPITGLDINVGQKRFNMGVGQTFTVGDSINPVIGFFDQKTGFRGASVVWSPSSWASASAAVSTEEGRADRLRAVGQVSFLLDKLQWTAAVVSEKDTTFNPSTGVSYDLGGVILSAEGAAEFLPQGLRPSTSTWSAPTAWTAPAFSGSAGARYQFTLGDWDTTLSAEYLHWAQGWTKSEDNAWKSNFAPGLAQTTLGATRGIRDQENAFFRLLLVNGTILSASQFAAVDLQDYSCLGQSSITWTPWDNVDFVLTWLYSIGAADSAWSVVDTTGDRYQASIATTYHF